MHFNVHDVDGIESVRYNVRIRRCNMLNTNITNFRKNIFTILEQTIKFNEPVHISTKDGNAIIISEEDYRGLMETLYLSSIPSMREKIAEGLHTPLEECLSEDEVEW